MISPSIDMTDDLGLSFHGGDPESGDVFVVETKARQGMTLQSHKHRHGHLSVLVSGVADVTIDGVTERMTGYRLVTIPDNTMHVVTAITDVIWLCLWAGDLVSHDEAQESLKLVGNYGLPRAEQEN